MKNAALAELIRKGLEIPHVIENSSTPGVSIEGNTVYANIIGLALLGTGRTPAESAQLFKTGFGGGPDKLKAIQLVDRLLGNIGADVTISLVERHYEVDAGTIIEELQGGLFEVVNVYD